jgi:hypothetical protein
VFNFDNIGNAFLTVFGIISTDSWMTILYNLMDADIPVVAALYCCVIIIFGSFFMLNLLLAVVVSA